MELLVFPNIAEFQFLRPLWLLAIIPALLLSILLWLRKRNQSAWQGLIDSHLLKVLVEGEVSQNFRWQLIALVFIWLVACLAMAGPTWEKIPQPVHQSEAAVIILYDLSPSMMAEDLKPSRLLRARYKIIDFLNARNEGTTALIAYAGEAHIVTPLTDDTKTITNLLPALEPAMMPLAGSNTEMAVTIAKQMFDDAGIGRGDILIVSDGVDSAAFDSIRNTLAGTNFRLSILGVGSADGAPIPTGNGGFLRDDSRNVVVAKLNRSQLQSLSAELGGIYIDLRPDDKDVQTLVAQTLNQNVQQDQRVTEREFDVWRDQGPWLALLLLPFVALSFRKGWVLPAAVCCVVGLQPKPAMAFEWEDWWLRKDQQAQRSFKKGDASAAAEEFESPDWKGTANYRAENYEQAANNFSQGDGASDHYNRGNALARAGKLEEALAAYDTALERQDNFEDAQFNRQLVEQVLEQQKQQQSQDGDSQGQDQQNQQADGDQQQDSSQQDGDQQQQAQSQNQSQSGEPQDQQGEQPQQNQQGNEAAARELADREQTGQELSDEELQQLQDQQAQAEQNDQRQGQSPQANSTLSDAQRQEDEQQQALEQWLRQVPDDPSGLMREKFNYQSRRLLQDYRSGRWVPPENRAYERY